MNWYEKTFNTVKAHLLKQGDRSVVLKDGYEYCLYRHPDGKMCAVGVLLLDSEVPPDNASVFDLSSETQDRLVEMKYEDNKEEWQRRIDFLCELQNIHDSVDPELWEKKLNELMDEMEVKE